MARDMSSQWNMQSPIRRWIIIATVAFVSIFCLSHIFGKDTRIMAPLQLSQCYELMGSEIEVRGDAISESLEISRKFHAKQRESRKEAMTKASQKTTRVKPSDVLLHLVPEVACIGRVRVGNTGDGGKWMCNPWRAPENCVVYSLGSSDDISFERDINEVTNRRCSIVTVDLNKPNERSREGMREQGIKFVQGKIAAQTILSKAEYTIDYLMTNNGHAIIDVLKIDIEGTEFSVLPDFLKNHQVCQLLIEIHDIQRVAHLLKEIASRGYFLINYEINAIFMKNGLSEYSFIHSTCLGTYETHYLSGFINS